MRNLSKYGVGLMAVGALCILAMFTGLGPCASETQVAALFGGVFALGSGLVMNLLWVIVNLARGRQHRAPSEHTITATLPNISQYPPD